MNDYVKVKSSSPLLYPGPKMFGQDSILQDSLPVLPITPSFPHFLKVERSILLPLPMFVIFKICFSSQKITLLPGYASSLRVFCSLVFFELGHIWARTCLMARIGVGNAVWNTNQSTVGWYSVLSIYVHGIWGLSFQA